MNAVQYNFVDAATGECIGYSSIKGSWYNRKRTTHYNRELVAEAFCATVEEVIAFEREADLEWEEACRAEDYY